MLRIENTHPTIGTQSFIFNKANGITVSKFDAGFPAIRDVVDNSPQQHGTRDSTRFLGNRVITLEFRIFAAWSGGTKERRDILDELLGLCNPRLRPFLYESLDNRPERRILLRPDAMSAPYEMPHTSMVQLSFICPTGLWESGALVVDEIGPGSGGSINAGRTYPLTFPRTYTTRPPSGGKLLNNQGTIETYPAMIIYGPCAPSGGDSVIIGNELTQQEMIFPNLVLTADESVVIDHKERSIFKGDDPNVSMYDKVDWTRSQWLRMDPGENPISFNPTGYTETTKLSIAYRHNWI